jgi:hypothetical protein
MVANVAIESFNVFDWDNAAAADIWTIDGQPAPGWISGGHWGPGGADSNVRVPVLTGFGRVLWFRTRAIGPDCACAALAMVFYE